MNYVQNYDSFNTGKSAVKLHTFADLAVFNNHNFKTV